MKNFAEVSNDGTSVFFYSEIRHKPLMRATLWFIGVSTIILYLALAIYNAGGDMNKVLFTSIYLIIPAMLGIFVIRPVLWNLFGSEEIIISTNAINHRRGYGFFYTGWKAKEFKQLYYEIEERRPDLDLSTIDFIDKTKVGIPAIIFSSSVFVPTSELKLLATHLEVIFSIEHLTGAGDNYIHLN